jgi:hypothetical protein
MAEITMRSNPVYKTLNKPLTIMGVERTLPVTFDAVATVRLFGQYTLAGLTIRSSESPSATPK